MRVINKTTQLSTVLGTKFFASQLWPTIHNMCTHTHTGKQQQVAFRSNVNNKWKEMDNNNDNNHHQGEPTKEKYK